MKVMANKRIYRKPTTEIVTVNLLGTILEQVTVNSNSKISEWEWAAGKEDTFFEEEEMDDIDENPWNDYMSSRE